MLNANIDEIKYDGEKAVGIKATMTGVENMEFETKAKMILGDPSYFPDKTKVVGHVLKTICILKHPLAGTNDSDSCQIIIPQSQVGRKNGRFNPLKREKFGQATTLTLYKTSTLLAFRQRTMSAPRASGLQSSRRLPNRQPTTTWNSSLVWTDSARLRSNSWYAESMTSCCKRC